MDSPLFDGYEELILKPFENRDSASLSRIERVLADIPEEKKAEPFAYLLRRLVGKPLKEHHAKDHWVRIVEHKVDLEQKLKRVIALQTAAVDYFSLCEEGSLKPSKDSGDSDLEQWFDRIYEPGYHRERLKEEVHRSKRYNHALSSILLDVDAFHLVNERFSYETGDTILKTIIKIIKFTVRSVDVIARHSGDRFMIILPNTNKREAEELAERLRTNVAERTKRIDQLTEGVTVTLSVAQSSAEDSSSGFMKKMETLLENGKKVKRNTVYPAV